VLKPTKEEILAAYDRAVPEVIGPGLRVLFCGINPSLYSAAVGHHFARPGNRFWPTLHASGFTPRRLSPFEDRELIGLGYGVTNIVGRATATAAELSPGELVKGGKKLEAKVRRYAPAFLGVLGIGTYRVAFGRPKAALGRQPETLGRTVIWVLPNPSGLNAHYQAPELATIFRDLYRASS